MAVFLNVAKDAYNKRIERETVLSFLDALRGLGAICHILVQDTVAMMKDADREDFINNYIATHSLKFEKRMNILKEELLASTEATGIKHTVHLGSPQLIVCCNLPGRCYDLRPLPICSQQKSLFNS